MAVSIRESINKEAVKDKNHFVKEKRLERLKVDLALSLTGRHSRGTAGPAGYPGSRCAGNGVDQWTRATGLLACRPRGL